MSPIIKNEFYAKKSANKWVISFVSYKSISKLTLLSQYRNHIVNHKPQYTIVSEIIIWQAASKTEDQNAIMESSRILNSTSLINLDHFII